MRRRACHRSTSMQKRDTMHPSSKNLLLVAFFCVLCATLTWAQAPQSAQTPAQTQNQQQNNQLQPVQDLTPPTDAEAARVAAPSQAPNQAGDTTRVDVSPSMSKTKDNQYLIKKDVEEVLLYATV